MNKQITFILGVEISFLKTGIQQLVYENICNGKKVSKENVRMVRENQDNLTIKEVTQLLFADKVKVQKKICNVTLKENKLSDFLIRLTQKKKWRK